jgi:hypothetical protein
MERGDEALTTEDVMAMRSTNLRRVGMVVLVALSLATPATAQEAIREGGVLTGKLR